MKKLITLVLSCALALTLTACGGVKSGTSGAGPAAQQNGEGRSHLDEIKAAGKIVLGTSADYPPYEYHKTVDGKDTIVGWEIEMAQAIAKELGVELEIKEFAFDTLIAALNAKKVDFVISAMTITDERKKSVDFSEPYWQGGQVVMTTREKAAEIKSAADLKGKTVAVQLGSTGEAEAKKIEGARVKPFEKFEGTILDLMAGKVDAVILGYTVGKNYEKNNPDFVVVDLLNSEQNAIAFRKGDKELLQAVNQILAKLKADGTIEQLVKKYEAEETQ